MLKTSPPDRQLIRFLTNSCFVCSNKYSLHAHRFVINDVLSFWKVKFFLGSRGSSVGIAMRYGLDDPGIESRWGEIFRNYPDRLRGPPSLLYNGYRVIPWSKGSRGVMLTTHLLLVPRLRTSWAIPPLTIWALLALLRGSLFKIFSYTNIGQNGCLLF